MTSNLIWHLINSHILLSPHLIDSYNYWAADFSHTCGRKEDENYKAENLMFFCSLTSVDFDFLGSFWLRFSRRISVSAGRIYWHKNQGDLGTLTCVDHRPVWPQGWLQVDQLWPQICWLLRWLWPAKEAEFLSPLTKLFWGSLTRLWPLLNFCLGLIWLLLTEGRIADLTGLFLTVIWQFSFDFDFVLLYSLSVENLI